MSEKQKKVTLISQGCRMNHAETATMINEFKQSGFNEVNLNEKPDVVVINTCTVTENGDKDTKKLINKINRTSSNSKIALVGCQAQIKKEELLSLKNVQWVIGNEDKSNTVSKIKENRFGVHINKFKKQSFFQNYTSFDPRHTRVNLKIQDGCDFFCSFCIIPFARGPARSRDFDDIINDAKSLISLGVKEIILTGINLGTYENKGKKFSDILETLLILDRNVHIRISSIEPTTIDFDIIKLWKTHPNFCKYLHLPLQAGTDQILKKMRRKYTLNEYNKFILEIKKGIPDICIGTDIIVGFPDESDQLFDDTYHYLSNSVINYFHVFSYSERSLAHARKFDNKIPKNKIKFRSENLRELSSKKWDNYINNFINKNMNVLFEQKKEDYWIGSSDNYIKIRCKSEKNIKNKRFEVNCIEKENNYLIGEIIDK